MSASSERNHRSAGPPLGTLIADRKLVVCVGSGGVGKTTTAAAIGLQAAIRGRVLGAHRPGPAPRQLPGPVALRERRDPHRPGGHGADGGRGGRRRAVGHDAGQPEDLRRPHRPDLAQPRRPRPHPREPHLPGHRRQHLGQPGVHGHREALRRGGLGPLRPRGPRHRRQERWTFSMPPDGSHGFSTSA